MRRNGGPRIASVDAAVDRAGRGGVASPITIAFQNADPGVPHNVQIFAGTTASGTPEFAPAGNALITGTATATYVVGALAPGTSTFDCFAHPATMVGTLTVG